MNDHATMISAVLPLRYHESQQYPAHDSRFDLLIMKRFFPAAALLFVLLLAICFRSVFSPSFYYPYLVADAPGGTRLSMLQQGQKDAKECARNIAAVAAAIQSSCPDCRIAETGCPSRLNSSQTTWLSGSPLNLPSAQIANGTVIVYESANPTAALEACQESHKQTKLNPPKSRVTCYSANTERPLAAIQQQAMGMSRSAQNYLFLGTGALAAMLVFLLSASKIRQKNVSRIYSSRRFLWTQKLTLAGTDAIILLAAFALLGFPASNDATAWMRFDSNQVIAHLALVGITIGWYWIGFEHYSRRRPFWDELREISRTLSVVFLLAGAAFFYTGLQAGRGMTLWIWAFTFILIPLGRATAKSLLDTLQLWRRPALIIGTGDNARAAYLAVKSEQGLGYDVLGFLKFGDGDIVPAEGVSVGNQTFPVLAPTAALHSLLTELGKPQLIVALESLGTPGSQTLVQQLIASHQDIHVIPAIRGLPLFGTQLSHFFSHEVLFLTIRNNLSRRSYRWVKRAFDIATASMLLIALAPLFLVLSILIRRSGASAFYGHNRIGCGGTVFKCLKFRSMRPDADKVLKELLANDPVARAEWDKDFKLKNDPRVTRVGKFLRKTSLDELPQLINVIKGEMSLVGPRPIVDAELERYGDYASLYLQVTPGITGLWQVSGRNDTSYTERVSLDAWYVQNWSLWYDVAILFKTVDVVFNRRGAY